MGGMYIFRAFLLLTVLGSSWGATVVFGEEGTIGELPSNQGLYSLATGLASPDGLALHPLTGIPYVSEETAGTIRALEKGWQRVVISGKTPLVSSDVPGAYALAPLQAVEGIAFAPDGTLFAVEDRPGGRLLQFNQDAFGAYPRGTLIELPGDWSHFAWESVDVNEAGQVLLAGSNAEWVQSHHHLSIPQAILLYRDSDERWWVAAGSAASSFSGASFVPNTSLAVFTCELTGTIGWVDLRDGGRRIGLSRVRALSPEGICSLPDGRLVVAEEGGNLICVNPAEDSYTALAEGLGTLESVVWDGERDRFLMTEDSSGRVRSLPWKMEHHPEGDLLAKAEWWDNEAYPLPDLERGDGLEQVAAFLSPASEHSEGLSAARAFAENIPLVQIKANTHHHPVHGSPPSDPIEKVEFVLLNPVGVDLDNGGAPFSYAGFVATRASGTTLEVSATNMVSRVMRKTLRGSHPEQLRWAGLLKTTLESGDADGLLSVHFVGSQDGRLYSFLLNNEDRAKSLFVERNAEGSPSVYRLERDPSSSWLVALEDRSRTTWSIMALAN